MQTASLPAECLRGLNNLTFETLITLLNVNEKYKYHDPN
jgi:hypothetical protein